MLTRIGMDIVPPALSPDIKGLFDPSSNPTKLSPIRRAEFCTVKVVAWLLMLGESPDESDYLKKLQLLRYLKGT